MLNPPDGEIAEPRGMNGVENTAPQISVIVPHFNDLAGLRKCLAALKAQTLPRSAFEVVVSDNMSDCGLDAVRAVDDGFADFILATERGPGPARNAGVAAAHANIIAFTDCDCVPQPTWLEEGVKALQRFDIVGGAMNVLISDPPSDVECFEKVYAFNNRKYVEKGGYTVTANMLTTKPVFERVGAFVLTTIAEDVEWCRRATKAGFTLGYAEKALVSHPARENWTQLRKQWKRKDLQIYFEYKESGKTDFHWFLRNIAVLASPLVHGFVAVRDGRLHSWRQRLGAVKVLVRLRTWRFVQGMRILTSESVEDPWARDKVK